MPSMFYNYDHNIPTEPPAIRPPVAPDFAIFGNTSAATVIDVKDRPISLEIKKGAECTLYFALYFESSEYFLDDILRDCDSVRFRISTLAHRTVFEKHFVATEIFDRSSASFVITLSSIDTSLLPTDIYNLNVDLMWGEENYPVFTGATGCLTIQ